jgi:GntR family transcriptional regulator
MELVERISTERELAAGDLLPSQTELAELAGVSLITVRRALDELERVGRVRRHQGLGTFLAGPRIVSDPGRAGGLQGTLAGTDQARRLGSTVLDLERGLPSGHLAEALRIKPADQVWSLRRLRHVDGQPLIVDTATIPVRLAPDLDAHVADLSGSLYELLERIYGLIDSYEEQYLEVVPATVDQRRLLRLSLQAQAVRIRGVSYDKGGIPFDWFEQVYAAANFTFAIAGSTERRLLPGADDRDLSVRPLPARAASRPRKRS